MLSTSEPVCAVASYIALAKGKNHSTQRSGWISEYERASAYGGEVKNRSTEDPGSRGSHTAESPHVTPSSSSKSSAATLPAGTLGADDPTTWTVTSRP